MNQLVRSCICTLLLMLPLGLYAQKGNWYWIKRPTNMQIFYPKGDTLSYLSAGDSVFVTGPSGFSMAMHYRFFEDDTTLQYGLVHSLALTANKDSILPGGSLTNEPYFGYAVPVAYFLKMRYAAVAEIDASLDANKWRCTSSYMDGATLTLVYTAYMNPKRRTRPVAWLYVNMNEATQTITGVSYHYVPYGKRRFANSCIWLRAQLKDNRSIALKPDTANTQLEKYEFRAANVKRTFFSMNGKKRIIHYSIEFVPENLFKPKRKTHNLYEDKNTSAPAGAAAGRGGK